MSRRAVLVFACMVAVLGAPPSAAAQPAPLDGLDGLSDEPILTTFAGSSVDDSYRSANAAGG
jgi:hypothetical protein